MMARLAAAVALLAAPCVAMAAGGRSAALTPAAAAGVQCAVPAGWHAAGQENPAPASGQWVAEIRLTAGGVEMARIEVYPNPAKRTVGQWVAAEWQALLGQVLLKPASLGSPARNGLAGQLAASPQRRAQQVAFLPVGAKLVHAVCHLDGAGSQVVCANWLASVGEGAPR